MLTELGDFSNQCFEPADAVERKVPKNFKQNKVSGANAAATRLRESKAVLNVKPSESDLVGSRCQPESTGNLPLRFSIPLSMNLVERIIQVRLPAITPKLRSSSRSQSSYVLTCEKELSIWHDSTDSLRFLNEFPLQDVGCRADFLYFVLWGLSSVLPCLYEQLIGEVFGHAEEVVTDLDELNEPIPYNVDEPPFVFSYGQVFGRDSIHPMALVHTFITGATGSGKTYGGVKPLLQSFVAYRNSNDRPMGMLVIDPKAELLQVCTTELSKTGQPERLYRLGSGKPLSFFKVGGDMGLEDRYRTLAAMVQIRTVGEGAMWQEKGNRLNITMADCDRSFQLQTGMLLWGVVRSLIEGKDLTQESQWANILAVYRHANLSQTSLDWVACLSQILLQLCPGLDGKQSPFTAYTTDSEMLNQLNYRISNAEKVLCDLGAKEVTRVISTDLYPNTLGSLTTSIEDLLEQGKVILLQPKATYSGDVAGRLVKSRFFADVLTRRDMTLPVGYVADEFQRFITADRDTGEQCFLDRARAFRVTCVLATQSLSSIEHALAQNGEASPRLAVDIIVANSPTKMIYRSTDHSTQESLRQWIPPAPNGRLHVVTVRPAAQLGTGMSYYLCDGEWGMYQYKLETRTAMDLPKPTTQH